MAATPESARRVVEAWISIEVLAPQVARGGWNEFAAERLGQQRNRSTLPKDGADLWRARREDDAPPWSSDDVPSRPAAKGDAPHPWYSVVIGALPAEQAFRQLDAVFDDKADEDRVSRKQKGHVVAATVILDEHGVMVPDTLALASFAWGLGRLLREGPAAELAAWDGEERRLKQHFGDRLSPTDADGKPRPLTWRDLGSVSDELRDDFALGRELWSATPCAVRMVRKKPPAADILSSFFLPDLSRARRAADRLPLAATAYLGLREPPHPWDPLTDRERLADLLRPDLFPLGRWPGPGRHPLNLLQQAAVNATARDLAEAGLAAVNGPPGTGKTTLLRDLVAHVLVSRAKALAKIDDPGADHPGPDLMDFAVVVASANNAAVENVSLELPLRRALTEDLWRDPGTAYFAPTADKVAGVPPDAPEPDHAWGLVAARLGNAENRWKFFEPAWWDKDWGLRRWLDIAAFPGNQTEPWSTLAKLDPPPRRPEAVAAWCEARDRFRQARGRCERLRAELDEAHAAMGKLRELEAKLPAAEEAVRTASTDLESATRAAATVARSMEECRREEEIEAAKLKALHASAPSFLSRLFRTAAWRAHAAEVRARLAPLEEAQRARKDAVARHRTARRERDQLAGAHERAVREWDRLTAAAAAVKPRLTRAGAVAGSAAPDRGFWSRPDDELQRASPWNGGEFRDARDALFVAAVRLHRTFVACAAKRVKDAVDAVAKGGRGASPLTPEDWGLFFLLVPVVSTTFASIGRMFASLDAASLGWVLVDEAGQACPQWALGAVWRARRAVVIGDPLQIEPVVTTPERTTRRLFERSGADAAAWAAPGQSAQTLADRASGIQARFRGRGGSGERVTGIPLLVHRRCERPMFDLANRIAYDGRMVLATAPGASPIRDVLGGSAWFNVTAPTSGKWVPEEGERVAGMLAELGAALGRSPDLYVISPFREPARRLKAMLEGRRDALPSLDREGRREWLKGRVGTVHTFQGKEAEAVILMLSAGGPASSGARAWAGGTPNLLNVAATRAQRALYVVGNRGAWRGTGAFAEAARVLESR